MFLPTSDIKPIAKRALWFLAVSGVWVVALKTSPLWAGLAL
jgi:hypothetical protein